MRLLIITQKVDIDDDVLGFFHGWIEEFAKHCGKITVICLQKGEHNLPENVNVLSLGKENVQSRALNILSKIRYIVRFYRYIWRERKNYEKVFIHMNPEYVVLGGLFWKLWKKKIGLWYTHKSVNLKLRIAEKLVDKIFTASKESFRLKSDKVIITGHGIDIEKFEARGVGRGVGNEKFSAQGGPAVGWKIITVGRIASVKNLDILIEVAKILQNQNFNFNIEIAGKPVTQKDEQYFKGLKETVKEKNLYDKINFIGSVPNKDIAEFYQNNGLFINLSDTGSMDKAVLEAMASGLRILTSNEAFSRIVSEENFTQKDPKKVAEKIVSLSSTPKNESLKNYIVENHNLNNLIEKILKLL